MQRKIVQQLLFKLYFKIMDYFKKLFKIGKDKKRETFKSTLLFFIMPQTGIEPVREYKSRRILSPVRLPVPPLRHITMGDGGFEPPKALPADLQSVPFGHSGNRPCHFD